MAIAISLVNFTDQGIKNVKESPQRAKAFRELAQKNGIQVREMLWTTGRCDLLVITEGPEEALAATLISVARLGNIRSETMHGMDAETFQRVLEKVA